MDEIDKIDKMDLKFVIHEPPHDGEATTQGYINPSGQMLLAHNGFDPALALHRDELVIARDVAGGRFKQVYRCTLDDVGFYRTRYLRYKEPLRGGALGNRDESFAEPPYPVDPYDAGTINFARRDLKFVIHERDDGGKKTPGRERDAENSPQKGRSVENNEVLIIQGPLRFASQGFTQVYKFELEDCGFFFPGLLRYKENVAEAPWQSYGRGRVAPVQRVLGPAGGSIHIISYNISWATQRNVTAGATERRTVEWCQRRPGQGGAPTTPGTISVCTRRALDGLINHMHRLGDYGPVDFLLFQEADEILFGPPVGGRVERADSPILQYHVSFREFRQINGSKFGEAMLSILYNKTKWHVTAIFPQGDLANLTIPPTDGRPYLIVEFENRRTNERVLVGNVHFEHRKAGMPSQSQEGVLYRAYTTAIGDRSPPPRYILGGDFNGVPLWDGIGGDLFIQDGQNQPDTCCWPRSNPLHAPDKRGDIIFDSHNNDDTRIIREFEHPERLHLGPRGAGVPAFYGSDHLPVFLAGP
jgi:hypothetical protein